MQTYFLILSAICGGVILLIVALTHILHNRTERRWRYAVWLVLAVRMLIPVDISLPEPIYTFTLPQKQEAVVPYEKTKPVSATSTVEYQTVKLEPSLPAKAGSVPEKSLSGDIKSLDWTQVWGFLPWLWLTGMILWISWSLTAFERQRRLWLRWSYVARKEALWNIFDLCSKDLGIRQKVRVRICKQVGTPVMLGIFRPVLLLPEGDYTAKELKYIFRHELLHVKRRDIWIKSLMFVVRAVHWFNPAVIVMCRGMSEDMEILCDAQVVRNMSPKERREYNEVLLKHMIRRNEDYFLFSTCFGSQMQKMKDRFAYVMRNGHLHKGYLLCALILGMITAASLLTSCEQKEISEKEESIYTSEENSRPSSEDSDILQEEVLRIASSYLQEIKKLENEYGKTVISIVAGLDKKVYLKGAYRLLDFDGDGVPELYCSYTGGVDEQMQEVIFQYRDGECIKVWEKPTAIYGYNSPSACTFLVRNNGRIYLRWSDGKIGDNGIYLTLQDGQMVSVLKYDYGRISGTNQCLLNGREVDGNILRQSMNDLESGGTEQWIRYGVQETQESETEKETAAVRAALLTAAETGILEPNGITGVWKECVPRNLAQETEPVPGDPVASAYRQVIASLEALYGERHSDQWYYKGLCMVRRIDFDGDGIEELYCAYPVSDDMGSYPPFYREEIYQYQDGRAVRIYWGNTLNEGTGENPQIHFLFKNGKVYLKGGSSFDYHYKELKDGQMKTVFSYTVFFSYSVNGIELDREETDAEIAGFEEGGRREVYTYYKEFPRDLPVVDVEKI